MINRAPLTFQMSLNQPDLMIFFEVLKVLLSSLNRQWRDLLSAASGFSLQFFSEKSNCENLSSLRHQEPLVLSQAPVFVTCR